MNTTENNKLIAEFMNYANNRPLTDSLLLTLYKDWNSIMSVVEKIESLEGHLHICDNNVFVHFPKRCKDCIRIDGERLNLNKIKSVYNACIEFIKWHNENKLLK